jgi:hypothetical protein
MGHWFPSMANRADFLKTNCLKWSQRYAFLDYPKSKTKIV